MSKRTEIVELTNMCMIENGSRVLVQDRQNKDWPGITFPGGHIEKGESIVESVIREIKEETGLEVKKVKMCGVKQFQLDEDTRYIVFLFKTDDFTGEVTSSSEGEVFWIEKKDLNKYKLSNDFEKMYEIFIDDSLNEFIYLEDEVVLK